MFFSPDHTDLSRAWGYRGVRMFVLFENLYNSAVYTAGPTGAHTHTRAYAFIARERRVDYGCSDNKHNNYIRFGLLAPRARTHNGDPLLRVLIMIITTIGRVTARFFPFFLSPPSPITYLTLPSCFVREKKSQKPRRLRTGGVKYSPSKCVHDLSSARENRTEICRNPSTRHNS